MEEPQNIPNVSYVQSSASQALCEVGDPDIWWAGGGTSSSSDGSLLPFPIPGDVNQ
ncbi:MAG TPA: hypothetical protein VMR33_12080 [Candidatus Baltobacteraceae bacterium]|nr:hypothetical protein [Candidatus Baltobacteraceae bacterium]